MLTGSCPSKPAETSRILYILPLSPKDPEMVRSNFDVYYFLVTKDTFDNTCYDTAYASSLLVKLFRAFLWIVWSLFILESCGKGGCLSPSSISAPMLFDKAVQHSESVPDILQTVTGHPSTLQPIYSPPQPHPPPTTLQFSSQTLPFDCISRPSNSGNDYWQKV